ncbi:AAA family ATPase [Nonomuraea sp. NPDC050404]|uniref:AAA family ATPase n=1 Tax=Nonomuraea sp. NPDC050404 TaxID=3155783 RepID=UPI0033D93AB2
MKRYILTGTPGAGKTAILRRLEHDGHTVVEEAATDVIALRQAQGEAEPWTSPSFVGEIAALQRRRQERAAALPCEVQFYDRSPVCTLALATYLGHPVSEALSRELERVRNERVYEREVFFVRNLGFVTPTDARRITYEESLRFERVHRDAYASLGYDCVPIAPGPLPDRVANIVSHVDNVLGASRSGRRQY